VRYSSARQIAFLLLEVPVHAHLYSLLQLLQRYFHKDREVLIAQGMQCEMTSPLPRVTRQQSAEVHEVIAMQKPEEEVRTDRRQLPTVCSNFERALRSK
jgi:hypothetical protein